MEINKLIVCLANSRKFQGGCVAGRELFGGRPAGWIRPVSDRPHEEVSQAERQYDDGTEPQVLDMIVVPLLEPRPRGFQQENWLLDPDDRWITVGQYSWTDLEQLEDNCETLWLNGYHTQNGHNDQLPFDQSASLTSSLKLVRVDSMQLKVFNPGDLFDKPRCRVQGRFRYAGHYYSLWVTDPLIEQAYLSRGDGDYALGESYLTISLSEPYKDNCYKLIAAVIQQA